MSNNEPTAVDPKSMAKRLRADLGERGVEISHSEALETVAHLHGHRDWNTMAARGPVSGGVEPDGTARGAIPILRMFDVERTLAFYVGFLGFRQTFEHRFADHAPLYTEVVRDGVRLHLSEHHGDATPGSAVIIEVADAEAMQRELIAHDYPYARPGVEPQDWGLTVTVGDPAGNRLVFLQRAAPEVGRTAEAAAPIVHTVTVPADALTAYQAFVDGFGRWWDPRLTPDEGSYRDAHVGAVGEPVELIHEGFTFPIGTVTDAAPGARYAQTFTLALDPDHPTTLAAEFAAVDGGTEVTLSHGGWTAANLSERARFTEWPNLLRRYAALVPAP
jgi:catechol 2,3-dioxygenase-like lactoylglutathione lyase family enzyme